MGWFSNEPIGDKFKPGDKAYLTALIKAWEVEIVCKDNNNDGLRHVQKYIVRISAGADGLMSVREDMLTLATLKAKRNRLTKGGE
jgi:hypothetical protein